MEEKKKIKEFIKDRYTKTKEISEYSCCGGSVILSEEAQKQAKAMGYSEEEIRSIPQKRYMV
jgi:arsenite methyltransferase